MTVWAGSPGVLLIHGFGGDPAEVRPLAAACLREGYSVHAPLLPGHGALPDALAGVQWRQWAETAAQGFAMLHHRCSGVVVVGFSMGALLALLLAAQLPVERLVVLAPALSLRGQLLVNLSSIARYAISWYYPLAGADFSDPALRMLIRHRAPDADLDDPVVCEQLRRTVRVPLAAIHQLTLLQRRAWRVLPRVTAPTLVIQGSNDSTVDPRSARQVVRRISSTDCRLVWLEGYGHQLLLGEGGECVARTVIAWLQGRM
ncbi:MAG: alpha/beta fold hydrolase [Roseiflexus sp.]|nr:alpha/beta fold hydrolase [Roseiflexus sp.]MCS7289346.1 alpha/beta fold hydrolase [Roseiflexus sp.]MDW8146412.1 alpha/beta fold hydrolase [Roseiflexaceae bacterium]MDW8233672.1 alpha/beta fold hydrolase [Roseiflexaceae bacterium]